MEFCSQQLKGHKGCVTCLETTGNGDNIQLLSGAEDKSIRFWNLKENKSQKCISGCFDSCVTALRASNASMHLLYAATEMSLYMFDIRFDGVLHRLPLHKFPEQFEDVNTLDTQCLPGNTDDIVAVGDDSGDIKLLKFDSFLYPQILRSHTSLVSAVIFNQRNPNKLISGGYDCCCNVWDLSLGKVKSGVNFGDISSIAARSSGTSSKEQLFNPPFVSSLRYLHNYNVIACGLGDGTIRLHSAEDLKKCYTRIDAHRGMITTMDNNDGFLASGGIDRTINLWTSQFSPPIKSSEDEPKKKNKSKKKKKKQHSPCSLQLCHSIFHEEKINVLKVVACSNSALTTVIDDLEIMKTCSDGTKPNIEKSSMDMVEGKEEEEEEEEEAEEENEEQDPPTTPGQLGWEGSIVIVADVTNNITIYTHVDR